MTVLTTKFKSVLQFESKYPLLPQGNDGGKVKCLKDTIVMDYDFQAGDSFKSDLVVPEGAYIVDAAVLGPAKTTGIFDLGDGTDQDYFVTGANLDADATRYKKAEAVNPALFARVTDSDKEVHLTCTENATATEGDGTQIEIAIFYVLD